MSLAYRNCDGASVHPKRPLLLSSISLVLLIVAGAASFKFGLSGNPWARFEKGTLNPGMPDVWDNVSRAKRIHAPLLWIHSRADRTNPIAEGQAVFDAAPNPKRALILDGYGHNAIYQELPEQMWTPMTAFIRG